MKQYYLAKIKWLSKELGGRQCLPTGDKYGPVCVAKGTRLNPNESNWSLIVTNIEQISELETKAKIYNYFKRHIHAKYQELLEKETKELPSSLELKIIIDLLS
jgi:hypothetical protein